jgi:hypothetical protein
VPGRGSTPYDLDSCRHFDARACRVTKAPKRLTLWSRKRIGEVHRDAVRIFAHDGHKLLLAGYWQAIENAAVALAELGPEIVPPLDSPKCSLCGRRPLFGPSPCLGRFCTVSVGLGERGSPLQSGLAKPRIAWGAWPIGVATWSAALHDAPMRVSHDARLYVDIVSARHLEITVTSCSADNAAQFGAPALGRCRGSLFQVMCTALGS